MATSAEALNEQGRALLALGKVDEAVVALRKAVQLRPDAEALHLNLGNALAAAGQRDEAQACYRRAIELKPDYVAALCNLASTLQEDGQLQEALICCDKILDRDPHHAHCYTILGSIFNKLGKLDEAASCFQQAQTIQPDLVEAWTSLAAVFLEQDRLNDAIFCCRRALELRPDSAWAYNNLGAALEQLGQYQDAFDCYSKAIALDPAHAIAHFNRATRLLLTGDFERGWSEYEWRWKAHQASERELGAPKWQGEPLAGRSILLHAEQGLGDTIQFVRYAPLVKRLGANVIVECPRPLMNLMASCRGIDQLTVQEDKLPPFDFHSPLLSLPRVLKTRLDSIPADVPYLSADSALVEAWQKKLSDIREFRIGIHWRGRAGYRWHRQRNVPLELFISLAQAPGVRLISLQKDSTADELATLGGQLPVFYPGEDFDQASGAFMDSAAIMKNLDLVITSDTSVPHLAGALGVPIWLLLPVLPDWRWLLDRSDSPWYPTMRLFRQEQRGNWKTVQLQVQAALETILGSRAEP